MFEAWRTEQCNSGSRRGDVFDPMSLSLGAGVGGRHYSTYVPGELWGKQGSDMGCDEGEGGERIDP